MPREGFAATGWDWEEMADRQHPLKAFAEGVNTWWGIGGILWVAYVTAAHFAGDIPWAYAIPAGLIALWYALEFYNRYGHRVPWLHSGTPLTPSVPVSQSPPRADQSPFGLWLHGDRNSIEIETEKGPHGEFRVLKFDIINGDHTQVEDVEVNLSGVTLNHTGFLPIPLSFERISLITRHHSRAINPGQRAEYVLMSLETKNDALPFWGDHRLLGPDDRR